MFRVDKFLVKEGMKETKGMISLFVEEMVMEIIYLLAYLVDRE